MSPTSIFSHQKQHDYKYCKCWYLATLIYSRDLNLIFGFIIMQCTRIWNFSSIASVELEKSIKERFKMAAVDKKEGSQMSPYNRNYTELGAENLGFFLSQGHLTIIQKWKKSETPWFQNSIFLVELVWNGPYTYHIFTIFIYIYIIYI